MPTMRLLLVAGLLGGALLAAAQDVALVDELAVLYPDMAVPADATQYASDTPRGVPAGVHVLVHVPAGTEHLACTLMEDTRPVPAARFYRLIDVPVEQNTGVSSRTEMFDGKENPDVVRDAPFRVFEVLQPFEGETAVSPDTPIVAIRVEVPIAADAEAVTHTYTVHVSAGEWHGVGEWRLRVWPVAVPPVSVESLGYTNWLNVGNIAKYHDVEKWSAAFWPVLAQYADLMHRGRQNTIIVYWGEFLRRTGPGVYAVEQERLNRFLRTFLDRGFVRIEGGHLAYRHNGEWESPRLDLAFTGEDVTSEAGRQELSGLLHAIRQALDAAGLPAEVRYLQHLADEPIDKNAAAYRTLADAVHAEMPGVRIFEATMSEQLVGAVDVWCPQTSAYQRHRDFFQARQQAGEEVWVYTCLVPGGPWLNRLLDQERLRQTYLAWALVKHDLGGFLHWGLNYQRANPFEQSVVPHEGGGKNFLPAGDSHVIYPGDTGPWSGQRFEAHRIGFEDAELLRMLKARDPQQADALIDRVLHSFKDFDKDVEHYRAAKRALLEAAAAAAASPPQSRGAVDQGSR